MLQLMNHPCRRFGPQLLVLMALLCSGCVAASLEECLAKERQGEYLNENHACGCAKRVCADATLCYRGQCCDPNTSDCGCRETCTPGAVCYQGLCCDPSDARTAGNPETCGCKAKCESFETCEQQLAGTFACVCHPNLAFDNNRCGCRDPEKGGKCPLDYHCTVLNGQPQCLCNPANKLNDSFDCGCRGPCPEGSSCSFGTCRCKSADQVVCVKIDAKGQPEPRIDPKTGMVVVDPLGNPLYKYICQKPDLCECDPNHPKEWQSRDSSNCACRGPCAAGEYCESKFETAKGVWTGSCACNPLDHLDDLKKCGCSKTTPICAEGSGQICKGGACICDPRNLSNSQNCGCVDKCDPVPTTDSSGSSGKGTTCQGGVCACSPSLHNFDSANCACKGKCLSEYTCRFGVCECDSSLCPDGQSCFGGSCRCDSAKCPNAAIQSCFWDAGSGKEVCQCDPGKCIRLGYKNGCRGAYDSCES